MRTIRPAPHFASHARLRRAVAVCALTAAALAACLESGRQADPYIATQASHLRRLDAYAAPGRIVFIGSSTFQGLDTSRITGVGLNLGIGGDRLAHIITRTRSYRSVGEARAVVLNGGLNDLLESCAAPREAMSEALASVPPATPVVVLGVQGVAARRAPEPCRDRLPALVRQFNDATRAACERRARCIFVPNPIPAASTEAAAVAHQADDGIHLNAAGYSALVSALSDALARLGVPTAPTRAAGA